MSWCVNILENALAAVTPLGGGSIALSARALNAEVELSVRDSGAWLSARGRRAAVRAIHAPASAWAGAGITVRVWDCSSCIA